MELKIQTFPSPYALSPVNERLFYCNGISNRFLTRKETKQISPCKCQVARSGSYTGTSQQTAPWQIICIFILLGII